MFDSQAFNLVGLVHPIDDAPSLCTPVFRSEDGEKYFLQESDDNHTISSFLRINFEFGESISRINVNESFYFGMPLLYGLHIPGEKSFFGSQHLLHEFFVTHYRKLNAFPFLFYQLAVLTKDGLAIKDALENSAVREAIAKRTLNINADFHPHDNSDRTAWSSMEVSILRLLWKHRFSASEIGNSIGRSRNSVLSAAKRLGLKSSKVKSLKLDGAIRIKGSFPVD